MKDLKDLSIVTVIKVLEKRNNLYELLNASFQCVRRLFFLGYFVAAGNIADEEAGTKDNKKYFLPREEVINYIVLIDGRNFYDQPVTYLIKQYDEVRKYQQDKVMIAQLVVC